MKTRICWRCSSRGRHENSFRSKLFRDWEWLKYCERQLLADSGHSLQHLLLISRGWVLSMCSSGGHVLIGSVAAEHQEAVAPAARANAIAASSPFRSL